MLKEYLTYLKNNPKGYWFKRKLYGWGWVPVTWQGWTVIGLWLASVLAFAFTLEIDSPLREVFSAFILPTIFLTSLLIWICYKKGQRPRWQWGEDKEDL